MNVAKSDMISVIVCSVSQERLQRLCKNVDETIGVESEMVAVDNRQLGWPIARVYNEGARRASGRCLLFVHEDVVFHQQDWGRALIGRLASPDCGVIGFAGSKVKLDVYSGWWQNHAGWDCCSYIQNGVRCVQGDGLQADALSFEPVVTLDGFALLVRREVWEEFPFDEEALKGFHCYDLDFTLAVGRKYTNYVCGGIAVEHLSSGNLDGRWYEITVQLHDTKWKSLLPVKTADVCWTEVERRRMAEDLSYRFLHNALRSSYSRKRDLLYAFWRRPFSWKHLGHCLSCTLKYLRVR